MPSPTSVSPAKTVQPAPAWFARLLQPFAARHAAQALSAKYPGLSRHEVSEKMRAELGREPTADEARFIDDVVSRLPDAAAPAAPKSLLSAWVLVAANLVPLAGVLFWGWDAFALIALFWMENVVIGVFFILRMLSLDPGDVALWGAKLFMVPFFCFHYGMFTAGHGFFVFSMLGGGKYNVKGFSPLEPAARAADELGLWLPLAVLAASHLFSFLYNYLYRGEFRRAQLASLMTQPYARIIVLHLAIIFGGFAAMALGSPLWALIILLALKIGLDFKAHVKEHSKA